MLKNFVKTFNKLPLSNKSMVYLMWIYWIWSIVTWFFINIYIFKLNNSFEEAITYNIIYFTSTLLWFSFIWWIMSIFQKDIKNMYYISYFLFIISFIELFIFNQNLVWIYLFWILYGIWNWAFRNAVHTQELNNIENKNRDFYSSSISVWNNVISIVNPLLIASIFYLAYLFKFDWYLILFSILPLIYLVSFKFIKNIDSYIPNKIKLDDFKNFFNLKKYKYWHLYFMFGWILFWIYVVIIPIINITLLKSEINIWLYQSFLTIVSTFLVIHLSIKRKEQNRFKYFGIFSLLLFVNYIFLWTFLNLINFIIFSFIWLLLSPLYRTSEHVYDLHLMDNIKTGNSDFYPAMIMREIILWIWRITALLVLLFITKNSNLGTENILSLWLIFIWICFILLILSIYMWEKKEK